MQTSSNDISDRPESYDGTFDVPALEGVRGRIQFVAPGVTRYCIIDDGHVTITPSNGHADTIITAYELGDLVRLVRGEINIVTSVLQGRVRVQGDPMLALQVAGSTRDFAQRRGTGGGQEVV